ncbi:MAG: Altronate dehydratase [Anaerocolumna sp.]|jgi:altronate hydrolase|nr:Altronate dehydratase [Anaerocolumna sp.]
MQDFIRINKNDNVAVALRDLDKGTKVHLENLCITLLDTIPSGHKFALTNFSKGDDVIKYGYPIGLATEHINPGQWIHIHNICTKLNDIINYNYNPVGDTVNKKDKSFFLGFRRENGSVGIRNEIWIIPTVGCVNSIAKELEKQAQTRIKGNIEGIIAYTHPYGCSQMGDDQENTRQILANLINHPNASGVLVLGLGCENCNIAELKHYIGPYNDCRVKFLECQSVEDELEAGFLLLDELIEYTYAMMREPIGSDELIVGLKCGGSDGLSGITANPLVGAFSDLLISTGGTTILTEVPEMFGAETILMNRCHNRDLFDKTVTMINEFKEYYKKHDQSIYENPSPGNKKGGISTLEDKSLGCTQKSGAALVVDVLKYGEIVKNNGLNLLSAPGNDLVASTALAAAGAHLILFTTGRGTPFASPIPTVKISSNSNLASKKNNWVDFDAGQVLGEKTLEELKEEFFQYVLEVASGKKVKSEVVGYYDLAIFKQGVTL